MLGEFLRGTFSRTVTPGGTHSGAKISLNGISVAQILILPLSRIAL